MNWLPNPRDPELATDRQVRELNILAQRLVDSYGQNNHPVIFNGIKQAAFKLIDDEGELRIRSIPPGHQNDEKENLIRIELALLAQRTALGEVWDVVSIETEGDNPEATITKQGFVESPHEKDIESTRQDYRLALDSDLTVRLWIFGARYDEHQGHLQDTRYSPELHAKTMRVLGNIKGAYSPEGPTET
jgi:hypothetical protein